MKLRSVTTEAVSQPTAMSTSKPPNTAASKLSADSYQPAQNERLVNMLQQQPDVRPEAVAMAKSLAADPNYPNASMIAGLAKMAISSASQE